MKTAPIAPPISSYYAAAMRPLLAKAVTDRAAGFANTHLEKTAGEILAAIGRQKVEVFGPSYAADLFAGVTAGTQSEVDKTRASVKNPEMGIGEAAIAPEARKSIYSLYQAALATLRAEALRTQRRKTPPGLSALDGLRRAQFIQSARSDPEFYPVPESPGRLKVVFEEKDRGPQKDRYRREFNLPELQNLRAARRAYLAAAREILQHARQFRTLVNGEKDSPGLYSLRFVANCMKIFAPPHGADRPLIHCFVCHRHIKVSKRRTFGSPKRNAKASPDANRTEVIERMYYCAEHGAGGKVDARNFKGYRQAQSALPLLFQHLEKVMHRLDEERKELNRVLRARKKEEFSHASHLHKKALADFAAETGDGSQPTAASGGDYMHRVRRLNVLTVELERKVPLRYKTRGPAWGPYAFISALPADWDGFAHWHLGWRNLDTAVHGLPEALWSSLVEVTDNAAPFAKNVKALAKKGRSWAGFLEAFYREYDDPIAADAVAEAVTEVRRVLQAEVAIDELPPNGWAQDAQAEKRNDELREAVAIARLNAGDPDRHVSAPAALRTPHHILEDFVRLCESSRLDRYKASVGRPRTIDIPGVWKIAKPLRAQGWGSKKISIRLNESGIKISVEATRKIIREME